MSTETWAMAVAGIAALVVGVKVALARHSNDSGQSWILILGPPLEAAALTIFAAEHFFGANDLVGVVPRWIPGALFWTYFVGAAFLAAAVSLIAFRCVRWSAPLLALFFLIIVFLVDFPALLKHLHERLFWTLTLREAAFASGALVLAGSVWPRENRLAKYLVVGGRVMVGTICVFYAIEHFLFPSFVPGVPLEKLTPEWVPAPALLAYFVGLTLLAAGCGLFVPRYYRVAAAVGGLVLTFLTFAFYIPILLTEVHSASALEGLNYVADTLLFASTLLLSGFDRKSALRLRPQLGPNKNTL